MRLDRKSSRDLTIGVGLTALIAIAVATGILLANGGDDGSPSPDEASAASGADPTRTAEFAVEPVASSDPEECRLEIRTAVFGPDPDTARAWAAAGVRLQPIAPATVAGTVSLALEVTSSMGIPCDASSGYVGTRGGMRFIVEDRVAEMRRVRLDLAAETLTSYAVSTGSEAVVSSPLTVVAAQRIEEGNEITIVMPLRSTPEFAEAMNGALGSELLSADSAFGTVTLVGEAIAAT